MVSLRQVRYFIGIAEAGQVSAAASQLNISQSAVTLALKDLEAELGVGLFTRHATGLTLTREGHRFLNHARNIEGAVTDALQSVRAGVAEVTGQIRLGLTFTFSGYFVFPILSRFQRAYPGIEFEIVERDRASLETLIVDGGVDLALLLTSNLSERRRIAREVLIESRRRLWLSSAHPLLARDRVTLADVVGEPYVMFRADEADEAARRYWATARAKPNVVFETDALEAVRSMVANGLAVTILSDMVYRPWSLDGSRVEARELDVPVPTMDMGLAWKRGREFTDAERLFRDHLAAAVPT